MKRIKTSAGFLYQSKAFAQIPWLGHGFGTRGIVLDDYLSHFGICNAVVVKTNQIHGNKVHILSHPRGEYSHRGGVNMVSAENFIARSEAVASGDKRRGKAGTATSSRRRRDSSQQAPQSHILQGDAFVTASKNVVCFVRTADCVPILLCDPEKKVVGAVHAGWRGTVCSVVGEAIRVMRDDFGCKN
jgi:hypothetical protein